jgi:hypothetical protein
MQDITPLRNDIETVRSTLGAHLPWSPVSFIRDVSPTGDREAFAELLTQELEEEDDLCFVGKLPGGDALALFARRLGWDSEFFGYGVARIDGVFPLSPPFYRSDADYVGPLAQLLDEARQREIRYLFAPVNPLDLAMMRALGQLRFSLIETRCYYHMDITGYAYPERFPVRAAGPDDVPSLARAARDMVNPFDRFRSDPFIAREDADRLMERWIEASINEGFADVTIVPDAAEPTAFCTVRYHRDSWNRWGLKLSQPVFSAVSPDFKGWYRKLISEINYHLQDIGAEHSYLVTQITSTSVTWVWESLGYRLGKGEHIFRIIL